MSRSSAPLLLDSSAILTLIEGEAGAERVEEALRTQDCILPWPVFLEVTYISRRKAGESEARRRFALMKQLGCSTPWDVDDAVVLEAAALKAEHSISLADALIAAYARRSGAVLLHKDPEFESLADLLPLETLPYKNRR